MNRSKSLQWAAVLALGIALATPTVSAGDPVTINVSTTAGLYDAVKPANAGATVLLASGTYTLETSRPNGGRLVLPPGMELVGVERRGGRESKIVVPPLTGNQGAIRIGDHNAVRWITVEAAVFGPWSLNGSPGAVGACIDVNVLPATAGVGMSAEVSDCRLIGATRGIRCQHTGATAAGRHSTVVLERNETLDQGDFFGFGIQFQNGNGADGAAFAAMLSGNRCSGTRIGLFVVSLACSGTQYEVRSEGNVYSGNRAGVVLHGGRDAASTGGVVGASQCRIEFTSIDDSIHDNAGDDLLTLGQGGGITAIGGLHTSDLATPSADNHVEVALCGTRFARNVANGFSRDLSVFGGLGVGVLPSNGNRVEVRLKDVAAGGEDTFAFVCSHPGQPTGEPENIVEARIDGESVEVDCD